VASVFGPGKRLTPPGHQIVETGLMKLAEITGEDRYRRLARFFLDQRGNAAGHTLAGPYSQDHRPVTEQREAVGHAVRAAYMYAAMVDVAVADDDPLYHDAVRRIWDDVVARKIYLTGAIGARHEGEAFGGAYELPNKTAYGETCASIASVYWNARLFLQSGDARYVDVLERTLYNAVLAGISLKGDAFFYPNPLESDGIYKFNQGALTRSPWFDSSCCPTNIARFIPSVPDYLYATAGQTLYVNLYASSHADATVGDAVVRLAQETGYPWSGDVRIRLDPAAPRRFELRLRIPGWARNEAVPSTLYRYADQERASYEIRVNGSPTQVTMDRGYAVLARTWSPGDEVTLTLAMPVRRVVADDRVVDTRGKVALERGPIVYAVEGVDNGGTALDLIVPATARFSTEARPRLLGGVTVLTANVRDTQDRERALVAIPYYGWSHRGPGEMAVWLPASR
jgi:DUF1680 family protein